MNIRFPKSLRIIALSLVAIGILALALSGVFSSFSRWVVSPITSVQTWVSQQYQGVDNFVSASQDIREIRQQNTELEAENARMQAQIVELQQQLIEFEILSALLEFARANPEHQYIGASVIGRDPSPFLNYIIINRGSDDGLRRGMPVVTQNGLAGRVVQVTATGARVSLITDPVTKINVRVEPSRSAAVLSGSIKGDITLEQIPQDDDVNPGNLILTSGLGGNYPSNIIVGQITSVRSRENALFQSASVQPVTDFSDLSIVLVIINFEPVDFNPLIPDSGTP
ncbi:MAG: rod shape-determining protein MreC [Chloroflexota bacterium]|nr:MAG: rod shape-determining protein MreC [Chloroflexota bacterium]HDD61808.1 rod shape-determining protein MreC [Chloroflexota bacterium]